jgi:chorismate dehydratase
MSNPLFSSRTPHGASAFPVLARHRVGCVKYLNSRPLIHAADFPVTYEHPSLLAADLAGGKLDVALVPVAEVLRNPTWRAADGVAIASRGEVYSVVLAHQRELNTLHTISLDPASRTSAALIDVLLREFYGMSPRYVTENADAQLLIGSQAIDFRSEHGGAFRYLDLGAEWLRCTGLPFVYAVWALRENVPAEAAGELRELRRLGSAAMEEIIASESDPDFARRYFEQNVTFDLGEAEKRGLAKFAELLRKHGHGAGAGLEFV